jgi:hypothetical protein
MAVPDGPTQVVRTATTTVLDQDGNVEQPHRESERDESQSGDKRASDTVKQ